MDKELKWWMYFSVGAYIAGWIGRSFADGTITKEEQRELVMSLLDMLGADIQVEK